MKSAVVYYSWTGKTEAAAKILQELTGSDLVKLEEAKPRKSSKPAFLGACFSALIGGKSRLKPLSADLKAYDTIFLGTPVWAGHSVPAINAWISDSELKGKKIYLFVTQGDKKVPQAVYDSLKLRTEAHGGKVMDSTFIQTVMKEPLDGAKARPVLADWVRSLEG